MQPGNQRTGACACHSPCEHRKKGSGNRLHIEHQQPGGEHAAEGECTVNGDIRETQNAIADMHPHRQRSKNKSDGESADDDRQHIPPPPSLSGMDFVSGNTESG